MRPNEEHLEEYRKFLKDKRRTAKVAVEWLHALGLYRQRLRELKVVDPACGSGAFLIQTMEHLKGEHRWVADETHRVAGQAELWDLDMVINDILSHNLCGVDLNPESVEIAKLALWLHTATAGKPLSSLDKNILCGNSLVGPAFYSNRQQELFSENERERINVFDWKTAFPQVFAQGGFDCVIGNPPYVKLQNFRMVQGATAEYLVQERRDDGAPLYASAQTGNWDALLRPGVRLIVENSADELRLKIDGVPALALFDEQETPFIAAQWRQALRNLNITESFTAKKLAEVLLKLRKSDHAALKERLIGLDTEITGIEQTIAVAETTMNALVYRLYGLSDKERQLVEAG